MIVKVQFLKKVGKKEDQCASIFHFRDRPELPYEVDFRRNIFPQKRFPENLTFIILLELFRKVVLGVSEEILMDL